MQITAKADYAIRVLIALARAEGEPLKADRIAEAQQIPRNIMEKTIIPLRGARLVVGDRGPNGGYRLSKSPKEISLTEIIAAAYGPLLTVRSEPPEALPSDNDTELALRQIWFALRGNIRSVFDAVSLADLVAGRVPKRLVKAAEAEAAVSDALAS